MVAKVLVADPPWKLGDQLPGPKRGASKHYRLMTFAEICAFSLPRLADNALLFLWRLASMQEEALAVARAWGFTPKSELVWRKITKGQKVHFGMGHYVRAAHETCILAVRGRPRIVQSELLSRSIRSVVDGQVGAHSQKPEEFYRLVEALHPGPYVELFARRRREGWTCYGNELAEQGP